MDRTTAFEILDAVHPDAFDAAAEDDPRVAEAVSVVEANPEDAERFERLQQFDRRVTELVRDVDVPPDLRERLGVALGLPTDEENGPKPTTAGDRKTPRVSRRRWIAAVGSITAVTVVAGLAWWLGSTGGVVASVPQVESAAMAVLDSPQSLPEFRGEFDPRLPLGGWSGRHVRLDGPHALPMPESAVTPAAYRFRAAARRRTVEGMLVVLPADAVAAPPTTAFFDAGSAHYAANHASVSWTEGGFVYVAVVRGGAAELEALNRAIAVTPV